MAFDNNDLSSDLSSPLSTPSSTPSPPPNYRPGFAYPSPPRSQESSTSGTPCPDGMDSSAVVSDRDGPPPAKRRRISERKPRSTEYLDLQREHVTDDEQPQLDKLVRALHKKRKIVVIAGAGISVSAGSTCARALIKAITTDALHSTRFSLNYWSIYQSTSGAQSQRFW